MFSEARMILIPEQLDAVETILSAPNDNIKAVMLQGGAGVGKTTVIATLYKKLTSSQQKVVVSALTGNAAAVLRQDMETQLEEPVIVKTLHSVLRYRASIDSFTKDGVEVFSFRPSIQASMLNSLIGSWLIIDEASMICPAMREYLWELMRYDKVRVIVFVGDNYQIPCPSNGARPFKPPRTVITLNTLHRSAGELAKYASSLRHFINIGAKRLPIWEKARVFTRESDALKAFNEYNGSKIIIAFKNTTVKKWAKLVSNNTYLAEGQPIRFMSNYKTKDKEDSNDTLSIVNKSVGIIEKIYPSLYEMQQEAEYSWYTYWLPRKSSLRDVEDNCVYAKVSNEEGAIVYIKIWMGNVDKNQSIASYVNELMRDIKFKAAKSFGQEKFNSLVRTAKRISGEKRKSSFEKVLFDLINENSRILGGSYNLNELKYDVATYWQEFFAIDAAIPILPHTVSTADKSQGMSVDLTLIDLDDLYHPNSGVNRQYVALTRSKKDLWIYKKEKE